MRTIPFNNYIESTGMTGDNGQGQTTFDNSKNGNINQAQMDVLGQSGYNGSAIGSGETFAANPAGAPVNGVPVNGVPANGVPATGASQPQVAASSPETQVLTKDPNVASVSATQRDVNEPGLDKLQQTVNNFQSQSGQSGQSESYLRYIPSIKVINKMTREELKVLKKHLQNFVLKEAEVKKDINDIGIFAKAFVGNWKTLPMLINKFYPEFVGSDIKITYNTILKYSDIKDSSISALANLKSTVKNSLDSTMNLINQSSDWISIILSKNLSDLGLDSTTQLGSLTIGKFLAITALCASIVYIMIKLFKSGFNNQEVYSECMKYFDTLYKRSLSTYKENVEDKLEEYMKKDVPTNILTLHSVITKCAPLASTLLFSSGYDENNMTTLPPNVLILSTVCSAMVMFYDSLLGKKFKSMVKKGETISNNLKMKMDVTSSKDVFSKLNSFKDSVQ